MDAGDILGGAYDFEGAVDRRPRKETVTAIMRAADLPADYPARVKEAFLKHARKPNGAEMRFEIVITFEGRCELVVKMPWRVFFPSPEFYEAIRRIPGTTGVYHPGMADDLIAAAA